MKKLREEYFTDKEALELLANETNIEILGATYYDRINAVNLPGWMVLYTVESDEAILLHGHEKTLPG